MKGRSFLHVVKLVSPFVAVVLLQAAVAGVSLEVMSSVRAYVAGEAMWSRSQKNAVSSSMREELSTTWDSFTGFERSLIMSLCAVTSDETLSTCPSRLRKPNP